MTKFFECFFLAYFSYLLNLSVQPLVGNIIRDGIRMEHSWTKWEKVRERETRRDHQSKEAGYQRKERLPFVVTSLIYLEGHQPTRMQQSVITLIINQTNGHHSFAPHPHLPVIRFWSENISWIRTKEVQMFWTSGGGNRMPGLLSLILLCDIFFEWLFNQWLWNPRHSL